MALIVGFAGSGCFVDHQSPLAADFGLCEGEPDPAPEFDEVLTYWQHTAPILEARCVGCHTEGGIGPFALDTYDQALRYRNSIRAAVASGQMPPWQPDDCCNDYRWDISLSPEERAAILAWVEDGAAEGDPANPAPPLPVVDPTGLSRVDLTLTMREPFEPRALVGADEVRCFLLDWPIDREVFVTGIDVVPGDRSMVHHVIVWSVDDRAGDALERQDGADGRPGWDCTGELAGDAQPTGSLGGWTPGVRGIEFPDGLGRKVPAGSRIVLNVHYDTGSGIGVDQTSVELMLADEVDKELDAMGVVNPMWLIADAMHIPADDPDVMTWFEYDPSVLLNKRKPFLIYGVNHHMHELGTIGRLAIRRKDGTTECLLNITDWDFDWLGDYWFRTPVVFEPGDKLYVECHWDNTAGNQKIVNGEQQTPRDLRWGTDEEMCAGILFTTEL